MTDELTGLGAQAPVVGGESSVPAQVQTPAEPEKMLPQSQVGKLISQYRAEERAKGKEEGRAEALAELNAKAAAPTQTSDAGNVQQQAAKTVEQIVDERLQQQNYTMQHQQAMGGFVKKMENGPKKYADFEEKVAQLNLPSILPIVHLANAVDNSEDVIYDLANNPQKIKDLFGELRESRPQIALMMVRKLSDSIKRNQAAANDKKPDEPLSQLKPSNVGTDNGSQSISALRKKNYLRG